MRVAEDSTDAADAVRATHMAQASVSMRTHEWDYLSWWIKKSLTIPAHLAMMKV